MRKINLSKPYITDSAIDAVISVLKSGWVTQGKKVLEFENLIKEKLNVPYALAVNSATSGLHIALLALGVGQGDEVIIPSFTWVSTANVVEQCGAKPIFVDIELSTFNMHHDEILAKITKKTKAIIIVHLFGKPFDVNKLKSSLNPSINIIEDAACALGSSINGSFCGTLGEIGVFSFHPRKSITTGEGGMIVSKDASLYAQMHMLRNHGQNGISQTNSSAEFLDCPIVGFNYRMTDFQAALGVQQLLELDPLLDYRRKLANLYHKQLSLCNFIRLPSENSNENHSWQSYVISILHQEKRDNLIQKLAAVGIETRPGTHAVHTLSYFKKKYALKEADYINSYDALKSTISLPLHNHMTEEDINYVSKNLIEIIHATQ